MGTTPLGISYPAPTAVPARAALEQMATTTDAAIQGFADRLRRCGTVTASATSLAPGQNVAVAVTFSPPFASAPCVATSLTGWPSGTGYIVVRVTGKSAAGCTINFSNIGSSTVTFTGLVADYIALAQE